MKPYRGALLASVLLLSIAPLFGCGNTLTGGSNPSGSYIRVESISPTQIEPDIWTNTSSYATVAMTNESAPNTPSGTTTNSRVTMNRYRVEFTALNMNGAYVPPIDGAGQTVGIPADSSGSMEVLVMDASTLEYIRSHYPSVGNGDNLRLRATITIWGVDSFNVTVSAVAQTTLVVGGTPTLPTEPAATTASIKTPITLVAG